jgi:hypothetical protein
MQRLVPWKFTIAGLEYSRTGRPQRNVFTLD